jgi:hypothetical protein
MGNIIQEFYEGRAKFEDYKDKIEILVEQIYNNDFRDYLDQLIRMRVNVVIFKNSIFKNRYGSSRRAS